MSTGSRARRAHFRASLSLSLCVALAGPVVLGCDDASTPRPPNIVLVVADDQSYRDFGFMGSEVARTPRLDALAAEGVVFTHGMNTASTCRPALRTLLTGLQPIQLDVIETVLRARGVDDPARAAVRSIATLPRQLGAHGYASFQGGKYWEGSFADGGFGDGMTTGEPDAGDASLVQMASGGPGLALGRESLTPLLAFIDAHRETPFFVWFTPMLPHAPYDAPPRFEALYASVPGLSPAARRYYANVSRLDARVGELLDHLDARGLREDTLVVFLSDNGWDQTEDEPGFLPHLGGDRGKLSMHENGFRTPIVFRWSGHIEGGRRHADLVSTVDLHPTLLELAGKAPEPSIREGRSVAARLFGLGGTPRTQIIGGMSRVRRSGLPEADWTQAAHDEEAYFLRTPEWRTIWYPERNHAALYRIDADPWEREDLAEAHSELLARHVSEIRRWIARMRRRDVAAAPTRHP